MSKPDVKALLEAGVHFGHRTDKWNPRMKPYIYEARNGIHVINLNKTADQIADAFSFLRGQASDGNKILFVGCKKQAQEAVKKAAQDSEAFYVTERWLGGTLTNLPTIRRSVARMREIDEMEKSGKMKALPTKQEISALRRESMKLHRYLDGIQDMEAPPKVLVIVDVSRETIAVKEALRLNIPIVALTDTNADPSDIDYPIACNDDAIRSIRIILEHLKAAVQEGLSKYKGTRPSTKSPKESDEPTKEEMEAISA
ncbi:MAG: 30S ribosomal protein S2 [Verrucomicrobiota bacterium]